MSTDESPFPPIDTEADGLFIRRTSVPLTGAQMIVARLLTARPGAVVTTEAMCAAIWSGPDREPEWPDLAVRKIVHGLRKKLKPAGLYIANQRGVGYRLTLIADGYSPRLRDVAMQLGVPDWTVARLCRDAGVTPAQLWRRIMPATVGGGA